MSAKYQIRVNNKEKFINIPITLNHSNLGQEDIVENEFVKKEIEKAINPIIDHEKLRLHPEHKGRVVERVDYVINLLENNVFPTKTTLKTIGFENDDLKFRRNNFKRSFLNLMFFDTDVVTKQNLLTVNTMFNRITSLDMVATVERTDRSGRGEVVVRENTEEPRSNQTTDRVRSGDRTGGTTTTRENDTNLSSSTSIRSTELSRTDSERLATVPLEELGTFERVDRTTTEPRSNMVTEQINPINSGVPKDVAVIPLRFIVEDPIKTPRGFAEGYYLYHQMVDLPNSIYMRANYNNAKTGLSTDLVTSKVPETVENIISKLHTKYDLKIDGDIYYYELDTEYSENISYNNNRLTVNLFEIQVL